MAHSNIHASSATLDYFPGEEFLIRALQNQLCFLINNKPIKRGRLLHFKKHHFCMVLTLLTPKNNSENTEIPLPFKVEEHLENGKDIVYFDYRIKTLIKDAEDNPLLDKVLREYQEKNQYYNNILEIITL